uniref:Integrase, catalytic region, zinc finger, CCHC-type, peptidase aspartic, catalytic n=1 Tax=Tanacetum cinerariifolium TaxID=118510 RepID=A0A6L2PC08_TANCI|nr:hypothetical protein [Tanacetum cinerariifolium]
MSFSLAENVIVAGADNRPPMLDKTQYSSWASRMLLYIKGKENCKLLVDSVINGSFLYGTITEPETLTTHAIMRARRYDELTDAEKLREACDIKATNIVLKGLPQDIYNLVNHHEEAKHIWDRVKLLIEGSKISLQESESKLYDEFDMFTLVPREKIHSYYLRFTHLINDMHAISMTIKPIQVNTKFINHLQPKWSKFVTDVKLAKDLHNTNLTTFCDEAPSVNVVLMAKISSYDSKVLSKVPTHDTYLDNKIIDQKRKTYEIKEKELLIKNDRLLELIISQDLGHTAVNTLAAIADYQKMEQSYMDKYNECLKFKAELSKKNDIVDKVLGCYRLVSEPGVMSTSTHPIIILSDPDVEDAFSSTNTPDYTSASPDYFPASPRNTSFDPLEDLSKYLLASLAISPFHDDPYMKIMQAYNATSNESLIPPQAPIAPPTVLPSSPVLSLSPISPSSRYEESSGQDPLDPKRTSTSAAPAMTQAAIRKLVDDSVATALKAQAATMANTDNTNRNTEQRETPIARKCSYKEFMSCQPFNFKGTEGPICLIRWFKQTELVFSAVTVPRIAK